MVYMVEGKEYFSTNLYMIQFESSFKNLIVYSKQC